MLKYLSFKENCDLIYYKLAEGPDVARGKKILKKKNFGKKKFDFF